MHPILEPLVVQLPDNAISRKLIESSSEYKDILDQLASEQQWCKYPETADNDIKLVFCIYKRLGIKNGSRMQKKMILCEWLVCCNYCTIHVQP